MARKAKAKPKSPELIAAEALARRMVTFNAVSLPAGSAALDTFDDVEITRTGEERATQKAGEDGARRLDAFGALETTMPPGAYDAARRLDMDMTIRAGEHDRGKFMGRVDCEPRSNRTDAMIQAGRRVDAVTARLQPRDWWLLSELIQPTRPGEKWRQTVGRITGEENANAQGAAVRASCVNLRDIYAQLDVGAKAAA